MTNMLVTEATRQPWIEAVAARPVVVRMIVISSLMMFVDGYDLQTLAYVAPVIIGEWKVAPSAFGFAFSAGLAGMMAGGVLFGIIADRIGRRRAALFGLGLCGFFSFLVMFSNDIVGLSILRFLTGIGIGGLVPSLYALNQEGVPHRMRSSVVALITLGHVAGSSCAGFLSPAILSNWGWQAMFGLGGAMSILTVVAGYLFLPESTTHLTVRAQSLVETRPDPVVLRTIEESDLPSSQPTSIVKNIGLSSLFTGQMRFVTPLVWLCYVCTSFTLFLIVSWLPLLARAVGYSVTHGSFGLALFSLAGGVGGLAATALIDRCGLATAVVSPVAATILFVTLGSVPLSGTLFLWVMLATGFFTLGSHLAVSGMIGLLYPDRHRATGIGWAISVSKIGSIAGPIVGGILIGSAIPKRSIFFVAALPMPVLIICLLVLWRITYVASDPSRG